MKERLIPAQFSVLTHDAMTGQTRAYVTDYVEIEKLARGWIKGVTLLAWDAAGDLRCPSEFGAWEAA